MHFQDIETGNRGPPRRHNIQVYLRISVICGFPKYDSLMQMGMLRRVV